MPFLPPPPPAAFLFSHFFRYFFVCVCVCVCHGEEGGTVEGVHRAGGWPPYRVVSGGRLLHQLPLGRPGRADVA